MHWHMKCVPCALVYFDTRKYTLKPKLTVFSSCGHYNALQCMYRKSNFVLVLPVEILKTLTAQSAKKTAKVQDSFEF